MKRSQTLVLLFAFGLVILLLTFVSVTARPLDPLDVERQPAPQVTAIIGKHGGVLGSPEDGVYYLFSPGTFTTTAVITHTPRSTGGVPGSAPRVNIGHNFETAALYSPLGIPAYPLQDFTIVVHYVEAETRETVEGALKMYEWQGSSWTRQGFTTDVYPEANRLSAVVDRFGLFAVLGDAAQKLYLPVVLRQSGG
jgi:hypothetical protein